MKKLPFILLICLLINCIQYEPKVKNNTIDVKYSTELCSNIIPFEIVNDLPIIEGELNGIKARFLIDSGATISGLDLNAMYIYGYSIDTTKPVQNVTGIGGSQSLYYLKNYKFNFCVNDTTPIIFRGMNLKKFRLDYGILGILGSDFLKNHKFTIDYNNKVIKRKK
jgi:hypothetical protein